MSFERILQEIGQTPDGRLVLAGVFQYHIKEELPLSRLFYALSRMGAVPDWTSFYKEALNAGMTSEQIFAKLSPALFVVFGPEFRNDVLGKLQAL